VTSAGNTTVRPSLLDGVTLFAVAALWGASFLFIRVAVRDLGPVALIEARVLLAGLALLIGDPAVWATGAPCSLARWLRSHRPMC